MMMRWWWWWWWLYDDDDDDVCVCVCLSDRPIMSESYVRMAVDADQSAELSCSARGWPTPTMTWSRNSTSPSDFSSEKSVTGRHDTGEQYPFVSVLNISSVQLHDLGIYTCTAQNNMGVDVTYFNLSVRSKLHITPFVCCEGCIMNWACCYVANRSTVWFFAVDSIHRYSSRHTICHLVTFFSSSLLTNIGIEYRNK